MDDRPYVRVLWRPASRSPSRSPSPAPEDAPPGQVPAPRAPPDRAPSAADGDPLAGSAHVNQDRAQAADPSTGFALLSAAVPASQAGTQPIPNKRRKRARPTRRLRSQRRRQTDRIDFTPVLPNPSPPCRNPGATVQASNSPIQPAILPCPAHGRSAGQAQAQAQGPDPEPAPPSSPSHSPPPLPIGSLFLPRMVPASQCPSLGRARAHVHHSQAPALTTRRTLPGGATPRSPAPCHSRADGLQHDTSRGFARLVRTARSPRQASDAPHPAGPIRQPALPSEIPPTAQKEDAPSPSPPKDTASFVAYVNAHLFSGLDAPSKPKPVPQRHRRSPPTWTRSTTDPQVRFNASFNVLTGAETEPEPEPETEAEPELEPESRPSPSPIKEPVPTELLADRTIGRQDPATGSTLSLSEEPNSPPTRRIRAVRRRHSSAIDVAPAAQPRSSSVTTLAPISDTKRAEEGEAPSTCRSPSLYPTSSPSLLMSPERRMTPHSPTLLWEPASLAPNQPWRTCQQVPSPSQASQPPSHPGSQASPQVAGISSAGATSQQAANQPCSPLTARSPHRTTNLVWAPGPLAPRSSPDPRPIRAVTPPRHPGSRSSPVRAPRNGGLGFTSSVPRKSYVQRTPCSNSHSKRTSTTHGDDHHPIASAPSERGMRRYGAESSAMAGVLRLDPSQRKRRRSSVSPPWLGSLKRCSSTAPREARCAPLHQSMGSSPGTAIVLSDDEEVEIVSVLPPAGGGGGGGSGTSSPTGTTSRRRSKKGHDYDEDDPVFEAFSQALARHGI